MKESELIPAVINALIGLAYVVLGYLGGFWAYERGRTERERARHFDEIKGQVLKPMLSYLTEEAIPILNHHLGNVGICKTRVEQATQGIMESSIEIREVFCYQTISQNVASSIPEDLPQPPASFETSLCRHAREHFPRLFQGWDQLIEEFDGYNSAWREYAEWLRSSFVRAIPLPEYEDIQQDKWARPNRLALLAMYRQIGIWTFPPFRRQDRGLETLEFAGGSLARGTPDEIQACIEMLNELIEKRDRVDSLLARATPIRDRASKTRTQIEDQLHRWRLSGKCKYLI